MRPSAARKGVKCLLLVGRQNRPDLSPDGLPQRYHFRSAIVVRKRVVGAQRFRLLILCFENSFDLLHLAFAQAQLCLKLLDHVFRTTPQVLRRRLVSLVLTVRRRRLRVLGPKQSGGRQGGQNQREEGTTKGNAHEKQIALHPA